MSKVHLSYVDTVSVYDSAFSASLHCNLVACQQKAHAPRCLKKETS